MIDIKKIKLSFYLYKRRRLFFFIPIFLMLISSSIAQINLHSISTQRQVSGDIGYTLDGIRMFSSGRAKLLYTQNFGLGGIYAKSISITDGYSLTGSLQTVTSLPYDGIFFVGSFNTLDPSIQPFSQAEIDSLYQWSSGNGKMIITSCVQMPPFYDASFLNSKWGYSWTLTFPSQIIPTSSGLSSQLFNGPFGTILSASQGGGAQGYFNALPSSSSVLATDVNGNPTVFMDCNTLDLIIADVDVVTDIGGITQGNQIMNDQDKFLANAIVFMEELQDRPRVIISNGNLILNDSYLSYAWYRDGVSISTDSIIAIAESGLYRVEVELDGGCKLSVDTLLMIDEICLPNVFTPNQDGINDVFYYCNDQSSDYILKIYNRWGQLLFEGSEQEQVWNGTFHGKDVPEGIYYYVVSKYSGLDIQNGYFHLLR